MKRHLGMIVAVGAVFSIVFSGMALAQFTGQSASPGYRQTSRGGDRHNRPRPVDNLLGRAIHEKMALEVLSELTGKDNETIQAEIDGLHRWEVLEFYGIDREAFRSVMATKVKETLEAAVSCGLITEKQASEITEALENLRQRKSGRGAVSED